MTSDGAIVMTTRSESPYATAVFRAAVDCARIRLPNLPLVLVDDCSPEPSMIMALKAWDDDRRTNLIHVIRMGAPRETGIYQPPLNIQNIPTSYGHAPSLDRGLWYAYHCLHATWALTLDGDVFVLANDMESRVKHAATFLSEQCLIVGEWVGTPKNPQADHSCDAYTHWTNGKESDKCAEPVQSAIRAYGYINKQCSLVYLPEFWHPLADPLQNTGWVSNTWFYSQMALGRMARYAPFFMDSAAVHLGAVAVAPGRGWGETGNVDGRRYAQKDRGNYYAGYLQIPDLKTFQERILRRKPGELVEANWFHAPTRIAQEYPWRYLRYARRPEQPLIDDQEIEFELIDSSKVVASARVTLDGENCRIESVWEGDAPEQARFCYEEIFEHTAAMRRSRVWTPIELATRLHTERQIDDVQDNHHIFFWRHFTRIGPKWRWSEHLGWGLDLRGPLHGV